MILDEVYLFDIQVKLNVPSQDDDGLLKPQNYRLDLRGLRENRITNDDHSKLAGILDMVLPSSTTATEESRNAKFDNLESCKVCGAQPRLMTSWSQQSLVFWSTVRFMSDDAP